MNKKIDTENLLKQYKCSPTDKVKRSVMARYVRTYGIAARKSFWQRGIPLYQAAAAVILATLISAFAVRNFPAEQTSSQTIIEEKNASIVIPEIEPFIALNDNL